MARNTPDVIGRPSGVFETGHEPRPAGALARAVPRVATLLQGSISPRVAGNSHRSAVRACGCSQLNLLSSGLYRRLWPCHQIHRRSGSRAQEATMVASLTVGRELSDRSRTVLAVRDAALTLPRRSCLLFNCDYYNTMPGLGQGSCVPRERRCGGVNSDSKQCRPPTVY